LARNGTTRHVSCHHLSPRESRVFLAPAVNSRHNLRTFRGDYALYSPETYVAQVDLEQQQGLAAACRRPASAGPTAGKHGVSGF
jgi:hypothetical protein